MRNAGTRDTRCAFRNSYYTAPRATASSSLRSRLVSGRAEPEGSAPSSSGPKLVRTSRSTSRPSASHIRRTSRFFPSLIEGVLDQVAKHVVGQDAMVERLIISLLTGGHVLLEGVPGLAKTLTVRTLAETVHTTFSRIQFTPDLLPADVVGTQIYDQSSGAFSVKKGPIFANIVLADEINRAPAKVQAALLEAMQEKQVTIGGTTFKLDEPFLVLATQNPIEQEGTYPLPEAQVDRFMLKLRVGYPSREEEKEIMRRMAGGAAIVVETVASPTAIMAARKRISELFLDARIVDYIVDLVHATRAPADFKLGDLVPLIEFGASPRATIALAQSTM